MNVQVKIEAFGIFYKDGARGERGGAAQNDKVWGIASIGKSLVTFWGRRNGKLKFKTMPGEAGRAAAYDKWDEKTGARRSGDVYTSIANEMVRGTLCPNLSKDLVGFYFSDMARGKLNTNH